MSDKKYDVVVIGGGPGGYVAAIRSAQLGLKVAVVEKENLGGICLNWGCIPTKALLRSAEVYHLMQNASNFGLKADKISFDLKKVVERSRQVSKKLSGGIGHLMKKNKIDVYEGFAKLNGKKKLKIELNDKKTENLEAENIIIATGARARVMEGMEPDGDLIVTYRDAMVPKKMPKSLLVVGSGAIGTEFASFYHTMGADVNLVEVVDRILPVEDEEISKMAQKSFEKQGIKIHTSTTVKSLKKGKNKVTATLVKDGKSKKIEVDRVILAVGIVANTEGLGLEGTAVQLDRGHIVTNEWMETDEKGIYAIGDVAGAPWLAHKASHEGVLCAEKIAGVKDLHAINKKNIPGCTYCLPQIASVGLTEKQAKDEGYNVKVGKFPYQGNGKAIALGEEEGLIKTIFDEDSGELLGAHMIGAEVTELIASFLVGKAMEATELDFMHTIYAHPTLGEMMHESVLDAYGKVLHM